MISPVDSPMDKVDYYEIYANINILATQALLVMKFSPYTLKIMQIAVMFKLFSNLIPILKNLLPNLNKGFVEPPCTFDFWFFFFNFIKSILVYAVYDNMHNNLPFQIFKKMGKIAKKAQGCK